MPRPPVAGIPPERDFFLFTSRGTSRALPTFRFMLPRLASIALLTFTSALFAQSVQHPVSAPVASTPPPSRVVAAQAVQTESEWDITPTVRGSGGYRQNATLTAYNAVDAAFWRTEADLMVLRQWNNDWRLISFVSGDLLRYVSAPEGVPGEQLWIAHAEGRWQPVSFFRGALKGVGFLQDTFIDPSEDAGTPEPVRWVRLLGRHATLAPRFSFPWHFTLEPSIQAKRITYRRGYDGDYSETRPGVRIEWSRTNRLALSAAFFEHNRRYSKLTSNVPPSRTQPPGRLRLVQREMEFGATTRFGKSDEWSVGATLGGLENRDQASGYLNYDQKLARLDVRWRNAPWYVTFTGDVRHLEYLNQKVGSGPAALRPSRITEAYDILVRVERELSPRWSAFVENRWERNRSNINDPGFSFSYRTNMASIGIQFE